MVSVVILNSAVVRLITMNKTRLVIKKLPKNKSLGMDSFKEDLTAMLKLFQKIQVEERLPISFLQGHYYSDSKTRQRHYTKRTQ